VYSFALGNFLSDVNVVGCSHLSCSLVELTGNLSAPGNLEVIAEQNTIHLKWNAPFSLQGVDIERYIVTFVDVTEANASKTETIYLNLY